MELDTAGWSGDGDFTSRLLEALQGFDEIAGVRVEDAPAAGSGANYHFLANEVYVTFATEARQVRRWRYVPIGHTAREPRLTLAGLEARLAALEDIGPPDYSDPGMLQYLRTERIVQPFQTRGYKLVELVRVYEAGRSIQPLA